MPVRAGPSGATRRLTPRMRSSPDRRPRQLGPVLSGVRWVGSLRRDDHGRRSRRALRVASRSRRMTARDTRERSSSVVTGPTPAPSFQSSRHADCVGTRTHENGSGRLVIWRYTSRGAYAGIELVLRARVSAWRSASREPEPVARRRPLGRRRSTSSRLSPPRDAVLARGPLGRPPGRSRRRGPTPGCDLRPPRSLGN